MLRAIDVREMLKVAPFEPFRIHVNDGSHYDVHHPDLVVVFTNKLLILVPAKKAKDDHIFDRSHHVSMLHITRFEPLKAAAASSFEELRVVGEANLGDLRADESR